MFLSFAVCFVSDIAISSDSVPKKLMKSHTKSMRMTKTHAVKQKRKKHTHTEMKIETARDRVWKKSEKTSDCCNNVEYMLEDGIDVSDFPSLFLS